MNKRHFWIIVIILHTFCFGKQLLFEPTLLQDSKEYLYAADNLIHTHTLYSWDFKEPFQEIWLTKRPILYPLILSIFKLITFGNFQLFIVLILLVQNLISLYSIKIAEKIIRGFNAKINYNLAAILVLFTPAQVIYANLIMSEIWLSFILILMVYLLLKKNNFLKIMQLSLLSIMAISLKPVMLFIAFCLPLYCLMIFKFKMLLRPFLVSFLPLLFLFGVSLFNQYNTGYYHYSSITNINLLKYNSYTLLIKKYGVIKADSMIDNIYYISSLQPTFKEEQLYQKSEGLRIIQDHLGTYVFLHLRGIVFCLFDPGRFDITQFFNLKHDKNLLYEMNKKNNYANILSSFINPLGVILLLLFLANCLKVYLIFRFIVSKAITLNLKILFLFFPAYITIFTGPIGSSRFAMPFFLILLVILLIHYQSANHKESIVDTIE